MLTYRIKLPIILPIALNIQFNKRTAKPNIMQPIIVSISQRSIKTGPSHSNNIIIAKSRIRGVAQQAKMKWREN
jgi:hypothetical protein